MCARYTMTKTDPSVLLEEFGIAGGITPVIDANYNIAPTDDSPIVMESREGERHLELARFGFVPFWADDLKIGTRFLNARVESAAEKPAFRDAFARHRCLVVADGFYEWRREGKVKVPFYFHFGGRPFGFA